MELELIKNDPFYLLVKERREIRSTGWLNFIGYTREKTVKSDEIETTEIKVKALDERIKEAQLK